MGLVGDGGKLIHNVYFPLGEVDTTYGELARSTTRTFLSLKPSTRYQARVFLDRAVFSDSTPPMKQHFYLANRCFETAAP